ncbi:tubulin-tyrosine ligase family-domain-containing protein [Baffinella frigidus]|nr:tubulin-tyrosine ligase family-domain-containing protein [Cryptophyta sp. CCMP2293]
MTRWAQVSDRSLADDASLDASALAAAAGRAQIFNATNAPSSRLIFQVVRNRPEVASIVATAFMALREEAASWTEMPGNLSGNQSWNMLWSWSKPKINWADLNVWQKVNHFQEARQLTRKDNLKRHIARFRNIPGKLGEAFNIMPLTYTLPGEYVQFCTEFAKGYDKDQAGNMWIMKPAGSSRGRGIFVFNDIGAVSYSEVVIVQRYVDRPLLLDGYKFDLRLYVLVTSMEPLEAFTHRQGFARLSSERYTNDSDSISNRYIHLTNSSINRHNPNGIQQESMQKDGALPGGSKISLEYLEKRLKEMNIEWDPLWTKINQVVLKTLYAVQGQVVASPNSFELFGFDVLIDTNLKCWLIEVPPQPSPINLKPSC